MEGSEQMKKVFTFVLAMAISITVPTQTMAVTASQMDGKMQPSEQNIEQIIENITLTPHPINSDTIQEVKEYFLR